MKKLVSLLLALMVILSLAVPAFAADSTIIVKSKSLFDFEVESQYTASDLFDNFKNVMPGDQLKETVTITNKSRGSDYIKVYMKAVPHSLTNPLTYSESFEFTDGKDQAGVTGQRDETIATMEDFLSQLTMRVYDGNKLIYEDSPDEPGGLKKNVYLGSLRYKKSMTLRVELDVPIELGNEYANRVGEVDWVFTIESHNDPGDSPKTGDYIIMGAAAAMLLSAAALVVLFILRKKKKQ